MQCLAEDRWEDYYWNYDQERYAYWGQGLSWVECPEQDPLGLQIREYQSQMTTLPNKDSDLSFYLYRETPMPQCLTVTEPSKSSASAAVPATGKEADGHTTPDSGLEMSLDGDPMERKESLIGNFASVVEEKLMGEPETHVTEVTL
jgi:hypothetical protein